MPKGCVIPGLELKQYKHFTGRPICNFAGPCDPVNSKIMPWISRSAKVHVGFLKTLRGELLGGLAGGRLCVSVRTCT